MTNTKFYNKAFSYLSEGGYRFRKYCGLRSRDPWCNAFVSYVFHVLKCSKLYCEGRKEVSCPHSIRWCYTNLAQVPIYLAMQGDLIYFDWNKNKVPDHIGIVNYANNTKNIHTLEGNTSGGKVDEKIRPKSYVLAIFRPHFKASYNLKVKLKIDGKFEYNSIAKLQFVLGRKVDGILKLADVKALQSKAGAKSDGFWGVETSKAVQKMVGAKVDGDFGPESVKALQTWLNKQYDKKSGKYEKTVTKRQLIGNMAYMLAYKTDTSKANWPNGAPTKAFKSALESVYPNHNNWGKAPSKGASCDVFVGTCVRFSGVDKNFPRGLDDQMQYLKKSKKFKLVKSGRGKDGDIIVYSGSSGGHICIAYGKKIKEAGYKHYYGKTTNTLKSRLSKSGKKWIKVYRAVGKTAVK